MTRVVHFSYDSLRNPWVGGGGAVRLHEIYKRLTDEYQVTVIAGKCPNRENEILEGVRYTFIGWGKNYVISRLSYCLLVLLRSLLGFLFLKSCDLIVVDHDPFAFYLPIFNRRKSVLTVHHLYGKAPVRKYPVVGYLAYWFERVVPKFYPNQVFVSESVRQRTPQACARRVVIYNGVDEDLANLASEEHNYILALGRVDIYNKGLDILIDAYKLLHRDASPSPPLVIAGDGKDMGALHDLIREAGLEGSVRTTGRVSDRQKREFLRKCLLVIMPSRYEGWGIVAIEAGACAKPVVGANIDGLRESIIDGQTGLLFERENSADCCEKMRTLLLDGEQRQRLGRQGRKRASSFMWATIASEQKRYFASILADHPPRKL